MIMYLTNSGKRISRDSILAFVEDNAIDSKQYAITHGYLAYNDHNMKVRTIDLDFIPSLDDNDSNDNSEEHSASPIIHKHRRRLVRHQKEIRKMIDSISTECVLQQWTCDKLTYELCKLVEEVIKYYE